MMAVLIYDFFGKSVMYGGWSACCDDRSRQRYDRRCFFHFLCCMKPQAVEVRYDR